MKSYIVRVSKVEKHTNADRLDVVNFDKYGWTCIASRGSFSVGDLAVYFETDSVLPAWLIELAFKDSKVKPSEGRIRAVKIRGQYSEGLILPVSLFGDKISKPREGMDTDEALGVVKYEPPTRHVTLQHPGKKRIKFARVKQLPRYIDTTRYEKVKGLFEPDEVVHITAKLHGSSARYGWVKYEFSWWLPKLWHKLLVSLKLRQEYQFVYGSRNCDFPSPILYLACAEKYNLKSKLKDGEVLFGEIVGFTPGGAVIQGNGYTYGCERGEFKFYAYALMRDGKYVDYKPFLDFCDDHQIEHVPLVSIIQWKFAEPCLSKWICERSEIEQKIPCREGLVIGSVVEQSHVCTGQRKIVKIINQQYLLDKSNTDEH